MSSYELMKPVLAHLRSNGVRLIAYLDDLLITGKDKREVEEVYRNAKSWMESLGFDKLREVTSHRYSKNGVHWLHHQFSLRLPKEKVKEIKQKCRCALQEPMLTIRRAGPPHRDPGSNTIGSDTSTIALPQSSSTEDRRASPPPLI